MNMDLSIKTEKYDLANNLFMSNQLSGSKAKEKRNTRSVWNVLWTSNRKQKRQALINLKNKKFF